MSLPNPKASFQHQHYHHPHHHYYYYYYTHLVFFSHQPFRGNKGCKGLGIASQHSFPKSSCRSSFLGPF